MSLSDLKTYVKVNSLSTVSQNTLNDVSTSPTIYSLTGPSNDSFIHLSDNKPPSHCELCNVQLIVYHIFPTSPNINKKDPYS